MDHPQTRLPLRYFSGYQFYFTLPKIFEYLLKNETSKDAKFFQRPCKENSEEVINEVDYSEAFGYEETKDMDYKDTVKTLEEMGVENAEERADEFGKIRKAKKKNGILKQRLAEKETLEE